MSKTTSLVPLLVVVLTIFVAFSSFLVSAQSGLPGSWQRKRLHPLGREDFGFTCTTPDTGSDMFLYMTGGRRANTAAPGVWEYDTAWRQWNLVFSDGFDDEHISFDLHAFDVNGEVSLLAVGGRSMRTQAPVDQVQGMEVSYGNWEKIDVELATPEAERASAYWFGSFRHVTTDGANIFFNGGVGDYGFNFFTSRLVINLTAGVHSSYWDWPLPFGGGTPDTDYPELFGHCCSKDESRPGQKIAWCFGGSNYLNDTEDVWRVQYGPGIAPNNIFTKVTTLGNANRPSRRRLHACGFVAQDKFFVTGGFNSDAGTVMADNDNYILDVNTLTWTKNSNSPASMRPAYGAKIATCMHANGTMISYMFGGNVGNFQYSDTLYRFNPAVQAFEVEKLNQEAAPSELMTPRAGAAAELVRGNIFVVGGQDEEGQPFNTLWSYSLATEVWTAHTTTGDTIPPSIVGTSTNIAGTMLIYGGFTDGSFALTTKGMTEIDLKTFEVRVQPDAAFAEAPGGRAFHSSFVQENIFVVAGGMADKSVTRPEWYGYDLIQQTWSQLHLDGNATNIPWYLYRYAALGITYNRTHSLWGLGFGFDSRFDLFWVSNVSTSAKSFSLKPISTHLRESGSRRDYIRGAMSAIVFGNFLLYCGGVSAVGISPPLHAMCVGVDMGFGDPYWFPIAGEANERMLTLANAIYYGSTLYTFGGLTSNGITPSGSINQDVLKFKFDKTWVCPPGATTACISCSLGTVSVYIDPSNTGLGVKCVPAQQGYYAANPTSGTVDPCPAGSRSSDIGASSSTECVPCALSTYQPNNGSSTCLACPANHICPIGASQAVLATSPRGLRLVHVPTAAAESQPAEYTTPSIPIFPLILIGGLTGLILLILLLIFLIGWRAKTNRKRHYFNAQVEEKLGRAYEQYAKARFGMSEPDFMTCVYSEKGEILPQHGIDCDIAHKIFATVDKYKTGYLLQDGFLDAVILSIETGHSDCYPDTPSQKQRKIDDSLLNKLGRIRLEDLDMFEDSHGGELECGDSPKYLRTPSAGLMTLIGIVLIVGLVMASALDFVLTSIVESAGSVPKAVVANTFSNSLQVRAPFVARATYWPLLRSGLGVQSIQDGCVIAANSRVCTSATATPLGFYSASGSSTNLKTSLECNYVSTENSCEVTWRCFDCSVDEGTWGGNITFTVSSAFAAPIVRGEVTVGSGIHQPTQNWIGKLDSAGGPLEYSSSRRFARPTVNTTLFSGSPATTFSYGLTQVYFNADNLDALISSSAKAHLETGYFVRELADPTPGSSILPSQFYNKFDVPLMFKFQVDSVPVLIRRQLIKTIIDLLTGLLGSVSGFMGLIVIAIQFFDKYGQNEHYDEEDSSNALEDIAASGEDNNNDLHAQASKKYEEDHNNIASGGDFDNAQKPSKKAVSEQDFLKIRKLMSTGISLTQAESIVRVIEVSLNPAAASSSPGLMSISQQKQQSSGKFADSVLPPQANTVFMTPAQQAAAAASGGGAGEGNAAETTTVNVMTPSEGKNTQGDMEMETV